jgi:hypothetical protein
MTNDEVKYGKRKREAQRCNTIGKEHAKGKRKCEQKQYILVPPLQSSRVFRPIFGTHRLAVVLKNVLEPGNLTH